MFRFHLMTCPARDGVGRTGEISRQISRSTRPNGRPDLLGCLIRPSGVCAWLPVRYLAGFSTHQDLDSGDGCVTVTHLP
jgi:hypothetical protein